MERSPGVADPNALTQPIPVVPAPPPREAPRGDAVLHPPQGTRWTPLVEPGGAPVRYQHRFGSIPAYLLARLAALAVDLVGVAFVLATFGYHVTDIGGVVVAGHDPNGYATLVELSLGLALAFAFLCEAIFGTTLGKLIFALHTRRSNGRHAGAVRVFVRYLVRPLDLLVIGPLLALVTPRHQRIGDVVAGTVVSRSRIGGFAPVLGLAALAGLLYAQTVYGGGLTSAVGVTAETADYGPGLLARVESALGIANVAALRTITHATGADDSATRTPAAPPTDKIN